MWVCELVGRYDPRTNGSVRIERLPDGECRRVELPVACRDIVGHKVPKYVLRRIFLRDTLGVTANHGAQLDLVIQFFGDPRVDVVVRADNARRLLIEPQLVLGGWNTDLCGLLHVLFVVQADGEILPG